MKIKLVKLVGVMFAIFFICFSTAGAQSMPILDKEFDLAGEHSQETQYFLMESRLINLALDGSPTGTDIFRLWLKFVPAKVSGKAEEEYICEQFTIQLGDTPEVAIPSLENWTYVFIDGMDDEGRVFGIDHGNFENLADSNRNIVPSDKTYHVYNAFIDFHSFCNVFADSTTEGKGIQDLEKIGQKIVHAAAFSEPPVNLGGNVSEGSYFKNGEITLEFKGLSVVNDKPCALIGYDSGESSFDMTVLPMPEMEIRTTGSSHYKGDIYKNLETNWVEKVTLIEFVVSETILPIPPFKINSIVERNIIIRNVSEEEFEGE